MESRHEHKESEVVKECIPRVEVQDPGQGPTHKYTKSSKRETTTKTNPTRPNWRRYCHVLVDRIVGEPPTFREKPLVCRERHRSTKKKKKVELR